MNNAKNRFLGLVSLLLVAIMTIVALYMPSPDAAATSSHTDTIVVRVYDSYPEIVFTSPENGHVQTNPLFKFHLDYENSSEIKLTLKYYAINDVTGEITKVEIPMSEIIPQDLDASLEIASGSFEYDFNLATCTVGYLGAEYVLPSCQKTRAGGLQLAAANLPIDDEKLTYNHYYLHAETSSPVGYDEDDIEFFYVPAIVRVVGTDENNNPILEVEFDDGVSGTEFDIYDENGNKINDEPFYVANDNKDNDEYVAGKKTFTLDLGSYGAKTGKYLVKLTAFDENGEEIIAPYDQLIEGKYDAVVIDYEAPEAPEVPDTGRFLSSLNISTEDYVITSVIAFITVGIIILMFTTRKVKKDYRKNLKRR